MAQGLDPLQSRKHRAPLQTLTFRMICEVREEGLKGGGADGAQAGDAGEPFHEALEAF